MSNAAAQPTRSTLTIDGRALSYLDFGGAGRPLLALHGHLSEGASFAALAAALGPEWRVIAPDQRGHGDSDRAAQYTRAGYLADLVALLAHLGIDRTVVLGHSLGGINGYHLAAEHPELVAALIDVDAPAELPDHGTSPLGFVRNFPYTAATREELLAGCGPLAPALAPALRPLPGGPAGGCRSTPRTPSTPRTSSTGTTGSSGSRPTAPRCWYTACAARSCPPNWPGT